MRQAIAVANRKGLTGVHDMDGALSLQAQQVLRDRGDLTLRVCKSNPHG